MLELHLFKDRNFSVANICIFVLGATLFGSMFLLPLYCRSPAAKRPGWRGCSWRPGIGAACVVRWAGGITDRFGPRRIVPFGVLLMAAATIPFAFVTTSTSEVLLAATLFVRGLGLGLTMMPVTAAAYFDLSHTEIPKASTTMNIVRQVGGSVATALFTVILERQIVANLGPVAGKAGGSAAVISSTVTLPPQVADPVAAAFAHTFWSAIATILLAFIPTLFLTDRAPAPVDAGEGMESLEIALIENLQRSDLNPIEEAEGYHRLQEEFQMTQEQIAQKVGKDRATVANALRLLKLAPDVQAYLASGKLTSSHARVLAALPTLQEQKKWADKILHHGISVREVEQWLQNQKGPTRRSKTGSKGKDPNIAKLEESLRDWLGTKVTVKTRGKQKGTVTLEYYSLDELDRILNLFRKAGYR